MSQKVFIKNMVCDRCLLFVKDIFRRLDIAVSDIALGEVVTVSDLSEQQRSDLKKELEAVGFEIIDGHRSRIIEGIKNAVRELVHRRDNDIKVNLSDYLSQRLNYDYSYLSSIFSEAEGITVEHYFISQKIERVKELLVYDDMSLKEIAWMLNYSSVAHLSGQFKKETGLTPSYYKQMADKRRKSIDKI